MKNFFYLLSIIILSIFIVLIFVFSVFSIVDLIFKENKNPSLKTSYKLLKN
jgi:hypothetical protein